MKPIRLALSGSGFKFPALVGALIAVRDAGFEPIEYAGTSGGSIVATLAAAGMSLNDMRTLTLTRDWSDMLTFDPIALLAGLAHSSGNIGYCSGNALQAWIHTNTAGKTFADLDVNLIVMASDISAEEPFEFSKAETPGTEIAFAARASASIPFVYRPMPVLRPGAAALLVDGGCCNNIPVDRLTIDDVPRLGVQLVSKVAPLGPGSHRLFDIAPRIIDTMLSAQENTHVELAELEGAKLAFIETGFASGLDRNTPIAMRHRLFDAGHAGAMAVLATMQSA